MRPTIASSFGSWPQSRLRPIEAGQCNPIGDLRWLVPTPYGAVQGMAIREASLQATIRRLPTGGGRRVHWGLGCRGRTRDPPATRSVYWVISRVLCGWCSRCPTTRSSVPGLATFAPPA